MKGILVFDYLNDLLFVKCDKKFLNHIQKLAKLQGLVSENEDEDLTKPNADVIMQLFSPIITSQHIMASQFGNSYTSIKCQDANIVFDKHMAYTFMYISTEEVEFMKRKLGVFVSIVKHICGPDVSVLKDNRRKVHLVSSLIDAWVYLESCEQSILTEAVEQLSVNADLASAILKVLRDASDKLRAQSEFRKVHLLLLVEQKFLSLYSSKNARDLCASDILLMILICWVVNGKKKEQSKVCENDDDDDCDILLFTSNVESVEDVPYGARLAKPTLQDITNLFRGESRESSMEDLRSVSDDGLYSELVLLGSEHNYSANAIHIFEIDNGIYLVTIVEVTSFAISSGLYDTFHYLNALNSLELPSDMSEFKSNFENLDVALKKVLDGLRKKNSDYYNDTELCQRRLQLKWAFLKKKYNDLLKRKNYDLILVLESNISLVLSVVKQLLELTCFDRNLLKQGMDVLTTVGRLVRQKLNDFSDFLKAKALKNFTLGSSLTINKYLEEFPGLVHFIYIDRVSHRLTAPTLDFTNPETLALTTKKIWNMVKYSRMHMQEGQLSVMWKDTTFNYAYFLWFEDTAGFSLKPKVHLSHITKNFPIPGIVCGDYYKKLVEACFPDDSPNRIRIYELFCVHLGLATSSCVLEHSRRLAATVWEVTGFPNNPLKTWNVQGISEDSDESHVRASVFPFTACAYAIGH